MELAAALDSTFDRSQVATAPVVTFRVDTASGSRTHPVRDVALEVAFCDDPSADQVLQSVLGLATRLSAAMDNRSKPSLLMVSVHSAHTEDSRRFVIWTFPQQEVFNLLLGDNEARLEVVEAFIRESSLRKVAFLEGKKEPSGMLTARVLDFQATGIERAAADLWIDNFLDAQLQMSSSEGTRMLARALRLAFDRTAGDQQAQDELGAAIAGARVSGQRRVSLDGVAHRYLGPVAAEALVAGIGAEARTAMFALDVKTFDAVIQFRRFTLDNGVIVSAPFAEIGSDGVELSEAGGRRHLKIEGEVAQEQVRTRG